MKRFISVAAATAVALAMSVGVANAAQTATSSVSIDAQTSFSQSVRKPVNLTFGANIVAGAGETILTPLMATKYYLPKDLAFVPDPKMPACTAVNENNTNFPPETARQLCPDSIIGDGTATIYLSGNLNGLKIDDPVLTIFADGKASDGSGKISIHAYSASTKQGIFMTGAIQNGVLNVAIPRLTADSATSEFKLSIPGTIGQDQSYAQSTCSTGKFTTHADFTVGNRDGSGNISNQQVLKTPSSTQKCTAKGGGASGLKISGPKKVKSGKTGTFKVTVKNTSSKKSKKGTVKASGGGSGKASLPAIKPGKSATVKVKVKIKGKKGKKVTVKFKSSTGSSGSAKVKVG